jgi:hypothetical protein
LKIHYEHRGEKQSSHNCNATDKASRYKHEFSTVGKTVEFSLSLINTPQTHTESMEVKFHKFLASETLQWVEVNDNQQTTTLIYWYPIHSRLCEPSTTLNEGKKQSCPCMQHDGVRENGGIAPYVLTLSANTGDTRTTRYY